MGSSARCGNSNSTDRSSHRSTRRVDNSQSRSSRRRRSHSRARGQQGTHKHSRERSQSPRRSHRSSHNSSSRRRSEHTIHHSDYSSPSRRHRAHCSPSGSHRSSHRNNDILRSYSGSRAASNCYLLQLEQWGPSDSTTTGRWSHDGSAPPSIAALDTSRAAHQTAWQQHLPATDSCLRQSPVTLITSAVCRYLQTYLDYPSTDATPTLSLEVLLSRCDSRSSIKFHRGMPLAGC
jgi:hypothetical protein